MKREKWWQSFEVKMAALILFLGLPNLILPFYYLRSMPGEKLFEVITYPFVISLSFFVLALVTTTRSESKIISTLNFDGALERVVRPYYLRNISCIGTKYEVIGGAEYWNRLAAGATRRFMLVSKTNKSWFDKGDEQSRHLAAAFVNLIDQGGVVEIISQDDVHTVEMTLRFMRRFIRDEIAKFPARERQRLCERLIKNLHYRVFDDSNYSVVVSDDTIVFMPVFNTAKHREEAPWLEIVRYVHKREYQNFMGDIERLIEFESKEIQLEAIFNDSKAN